MSFTDTLFKTVIAIGASALISSSALAVPTLWGVDEDDGELFRIDDYTNAANTFTSYGQLKWNDNGTIRNIGNDIEAFTIRDDGMAYMVLDDDIAGQNDPVLMRFDMNTASTTQDNVVDIIGRINVYFNSSRDDITGVDFDPFTGDLYALFEDDDYENSRDYDRLLKVDPNTGAVLSDRVIYGYGNDYYNYYEVSYLGEDLVFHENGNILVIDESDNSIYEVTKTGYIQDTFDGYTSGGIGSSYFEALAWDSENDQLIAFSDNGNFFALITEGNGGNSSFGGVSGLTDVEGLAFWEYSGGGGGTGVPAPGGVLLMGIGLLGLGWARRKFRGV